MGRCGSDHPLTAAWPVAALADVKHLGTAQLVAGRTQALVA